MGENLCHAYIWQEINQQNIQGAKKAKLPQNQLSHEELGKLIGQSFFKGRRRIASSKTTYVTQWGSFSKKKKKWKEEMALTESTWSFS
jgi:hypothetical protein